MKTTMSIKHFPIRNLKRFGTGFSRLVLGVALVGVTASSSKAIEWNLSNKSSDASVGIQIEAFVDRQVLRQEETFQLNLVVTLNEGWHIYSIHPDDDPSVPTQILIDKPTLSPGGDWEESNPTLMKDEILERLVKVHVDQAEFVRAYRVPRGLGPGHYPINGVLTFRACDNRVCTLPREVEFNAVIQVVGKDQV